MNKTIHDLSSLAQASSNDELIIYDVSEGESKKIQAQSFIGSILKIDKIFDTPVTSASATINRSLIEGFKFSDYDIIISQVSYYDNSQNNFMPIPYSEIKDCVDNHSTGAEWFLQGASTGGTDRRVGFTITSDTTFKVTMLNGSSGTMPRFQAFYGIKLAI